MALTPEQKAELDALRAELSPTKPAGGMTPEQKTELAALRAELGVKEEPGFWDKAKDVGGDVLGGAARVVDWTSGLGRTVTAARVRPDLVTSDDFINMLKGKAPTTDEYLERAGVGDMGSVPLWGDTKVTGREALGFVGDIALDPTTYLSGGTSATGQLLAKGSAKAAAKGASKTAKALSVASKMNPGSAVGAGGEKLYKSAFKNINTRLIERGVAPISTDLYDQGFVGGYKALDKFSDKRVKQLGTERAAKYAAGDAAGAVVDVNKANQGALDFVTNLAGNGYGKSEAADKFMETLSKKPDFDRVGGLSLERASDIKTDLYDALPANAFDPNGRLTNDGKKMLQKLSLGYKDEIVNSANSKVAGLGDEIDGINQKMSPYLSAKKPTQSEIAKADRKDLITQTKALVASFSPKGAGVMYGAQFLNSPLFRTAVGRSAGKGALKYSATPLMKRGLIESQEDGELPPLTPSPYRY